MINLLELPWLEIGQGALAIIGGAVVILRIVAPLTKNEVDNKVLQILEGVATLWKPKPSVGVKVKIKD